MKSMTGFGQGSVERDDHLCTVEIRTVNHRFCEISLRLPRQLQRLEASIRRQLSDSFGRGSISVTISVDGQEDDLGVPMLNKAVAERYVKLLKDLQKRHGLAGQIDLNTVAALPEFFTWERNVLNPKKMAPLVSDAMEQAIQQVQRERSREGKALAKECRQRISHIKRLLKRIERRAPVRAEEMKKRYVARIENLASRADLDPHRLSQELATLADRLDFTEECVRLITHAEQFIELLGKDGLLGRRLNFLLQEMGRETNTIGSKASDPTISMIVVDIKDEIEKLREQVQNLE